MILDAVRSSCRPGCTPRRLELVFSSETLLDCIGAVPVALAIVDGERRIVHSNAAAEALFTSGCAVQRIQDRLTSQNTEAAARIDALVAAALKRGPGTDVISSIPQSGKLPLLAMATVPTPAEVHMIAIFMTDPNLPPQPSHYALRTVFQLSASEARICMLLVQGKTLQECAAVMRIKVHSARTYLRHALRKTGTRRQSELIYLLRCGPFELSQRLSGDPRRIEVLER